MIIINLKNGENLDRGLKQLKSKVIKTKQNQELSIDDIFEQMREERSQELIQLNFPNYMNSGENEQ